MFNYICTIHNSEPHLRYVLQGIKNVKSADSKVYLVLDGCTDGSKEICDDFPEFKQIVTPDVRETKAITTALKQIPQISFNFVMQDDVLLQDPDTEEHIKMVYDSIPNIGVLSFRHGANFEQGLLNSGKSVCETDIVQSEFQAVFKVPLLDEGYVTERQVVYKSPICISSQLVGLLGGYDSRFEPIAHDDTEYCIRAYKAGYKNYVCAIKMMQPVQWGGTRRFPEVHSDNQKFHMEHMDLLRKLYAEDLLVLEMNHPSLENKMIWKT